MHKPDQGYCDSMEEVFKDRAGAAFYRKEMLNDIGLFDPDFFHYLEDVYMAYGAQMTGWEFIYCSGQDGPLSWRNVGEWVGSGGLLWQLVHSWYPIKDPARPRSPLCLHPGWKSVCYPPLLCTVRKGSSLNRR
jgi:hypothetical protein